MIEIPANIVSECRFPKALNQRLHDLLDKQERGETLTRKERAEADGLVAVAEQIALLKQHLKIARKRGS